MEFLRTSPEAGFSSSPNTFLCTLFWRCSINWTWFSQRYALQCCYRLSQVMNHYRVLFCFNLISQAGWVFLTVLLNVVLTTGSHHSLWLPTCKPWLRVKVKLRQTTCWYNMIQPLLPFQKKELCTSLYAPPFQNMWRLNQGLDVFSLQEVLIIWALRCHHWHRQAMERARSCSNSRWRLGEIWHFDTSLMLSASTVLLFFMCVPLLCFGPFSTSRANGDLFSALSCVHSMP